MSDDPLKAAIEAEHGSVRLLKDEVTKVHEEMFPKKEPTTETAKVAVRRVRQDPELARAFRPKVPRWEDLKTRKDKADFVDEFGGDAVLDLARRARL